MTSWYLASCTRFAIAYCMLILHDLQRHWWWLQIHSNKLRRMFEWRLILQMVNSLVNTVQWSLLSYMVATGFTWPVHGTYVIIAWSATWAVHDSHVTSAWSVTWAVYDQPSYQCKIATWSMADQSRDQCMISQVISAWYVTWSVFDIHVISSWAVMWSVHDSFTISAWSATWSGQDCQVISAWLVSYYSQHYFPAYSRGEVPVLCLPFRDGCRINEIMIVDCLELSRTKTLHKYTGLLLSSLCFAGGPIVWFGWFMEMACP